MPSSGPGTGDLGWGGSPRQPGGEATLDPARAVACQRLRTSRSVGPCRYTLVSRSECAEALPTDCVSSGRKIGGSGYRKTNQRKE